MGFLHTSKSFPSCHTSVPRSRRPAVLTRALIPTERNKRVEAAEPVDVARLQKLVENYRKAHPYVPPPALDLPLLERTEALLSAHCQSLPGDTEEAEQCYTALSYFDEQKGAAEGACEVVSSEDGRIVEAGCEPQHRLEDFVRGLVGSAPMEDFVNTLLCLRRAAEHDLEVKLEDCGEGTAEECAAAEQRERLTRLFYALDSDLNGKLDIAEFREGMQQAGQEMSGKAVASVLDAMGVDRGFLGLEEFLAIAEVEERAAHTALARWIRAKSQSDRS